MAQQLNTLAPFSAKSEPIIEISLLSAQTRNIINAKKQKPRKNKKIDLKKGQWSYQEDKLLKQWVKLNGPKDWEACGRFIHGRKGKQCREHWNNCLNPELKKGCWSPEEDFLIMFFYEKCKGSWKKIVPLFQGRIENSIKNRFYSQLRKYATKNFERSERKKMKARIKLNVLLNYLGEALTEAKQDLLEKTNMIDEEFNQFLKENEQKLKENIFSNLDSYNIEQEANLSTSLGGSSNEEDSNSNKISFIHKRKRSIDFITNDLDNIFQKQQADPFENNENAFEFFGGKEKEVNIELDEDKSDNLFKNIMSNNNGILNNNMPLNIFKNDMNELSIDSIESDINNSFTNSFKEKELIFGFDNCVINYEKFLVKNNLEHAFNINN
jgi:hypothetical protein